MHLITQQLSIHHSFYHFLYLLAVHVFINATQPLFPPHLFPSGWKICKNLTDVSFSSVGGRTGADDRFFCQPHSLIRSMSAFYFKRKETSDDDIKLWTFSHKVELCDRSAASQIHDRWRRRWSSSRIRSGESALIQFGCTESSRRSAAPVRTFSEGSTHHPTLKFTLPLHLHLPLCSPGRADIVRNVVMWHLQNVQTSTFTKNKLKFEKQTDKQKTAGKFLHKKVKDDYLCL